MNLIVFLDLDTPCLAPTPSVLVGRTKRCFISFTPTVTPTTRILQTGDSFLHQEGKKTCIICVQHYYAVMTAICPVPPLVRVVFLYGNDIHPCDPINDSHADSRRNPGGH